ncbi:helix-turn-helix domain-containing protein [Ruminococcus flavefaciens]|uniref:AlbA family DNA-binding domain-containing protein n=1 Tax=Ruminococcus flavefaciens TaxID=1265 RepID=UPI0004AFB30C|nr:ATP-binding protein [Ruminococcus flavefaciens]
MINQGKDKLYDDFLKEPTKDNFRIFLQNTLGEMDEVDFKEKWIEKGHLAKTLLAMANSRGGIIVVGVKEEKDGKLTAKGLEEFKDKAVINNEISKYIPPELDYVIYDFSYDTSEYEAVKGKKFQLLFVHDTPERLPFISRNETDNLVKDTIYIRRGTKCEKASASEIEMLLDAKIETIFKGDSDLSLNQHLEQLKILYNELPQKIKVLVRKGIKYQDIVNPFSSVLQALKEYKLNLGILNEYEETNNPDYPEESYEAFINRMIKLKKLKIEKYLDLK